MLRVVNLEEIQNLLLDVSTLTDLHEQRDPDYIPEVKSWLEKFETVLDNNRMPVTGTIAAYRGLLISAEQGIIPTGVEIHGRVTKRKIQDGAASLLIRLTSDVVSNAILGDQERIKDAERMTRQLVSIANAKGIISDIPNGDDSADVLNSIWKAMTDDKDLSAGTINVVGLVGPFDALILLDRIIASDIQIDKTKSGETSS